MGTAAENVNQFYTYRDYLNWPEDERWELIAGTPYNMSPAPSTEHQRISGNLYGIFWNYFRNKVCSVFSAPFDVRLSKPGESSAETGNVVQPDISIICDQSKLDHRGCIGAPDLIIEITSPATAGKDMREKLKLYERFGVKEYWILHPGEQVVEIYYPEQDGRYGKPEVYTNKDQVAVKLFSGLKVDLRLVFERNSQI